MFDFLFGYSSNLSHWFLDHTKLMYIVSLFMINLLIIMG